MPVAENRKKPQQYCCQPGFRHAHHSYAFDPRVDDQGFVHWPNEGMVGLGANNAKARIDNVVVQRLAPVITFTETVDFENGTTELLEVPTSGTWVVANGRYDGTADGNTPAISLTSVLVSPASLIDLFATLTATDQGGFTFDQYDPDNFKFVTIAAGQITLGHHTSSGWFTDATVVIATPPAGDVELGLKLKGTTASVTLNGQPALSHVFNALVTDGKFGLLSRVGETSFDTLTVQSDDPEAGQHLSTGGGPNGETGISFERTIVLTPDSDRNGFVSHDDNRAWMKPFGQFDTSMAAPAGQADVAVALDSNVSRSREDEARSHVQRNAEHPVFKEMGKMSSDLEDGMFELLAQNKLGHTR